MAKRFLRKGQVKKSFLRDAVVSVLLFALLFALFLFALNVTERTSLDKQKEVLEEAVDRSLLQCYVTEGRYPKSISYLKENYGISYDETQLRVDYVSYGSNLRPEVTVVIIGGGR
ncbi:MAG: hypothetical protein MJ105_09540 [Lachnospiraceae bacterium]|nr:hypothetical protein [Lachnospiraceae bacterium]